jgi:hypothetical protein
MKNYLRGSSMKKRLGNTGLDIKTPPPGGGVGAWVRPGGDHTQGNKLQDVIPVILTCRLATPISHTAIFCPWTHPLMCDPCSVHLSVRDILVDCPRYTVRHERFCLPCIISDMLGDDPDILTQVLAFLWATFYNYRTFNLLSYCEHVSTSI